MTKRERERLLRVAQALRESPNPKGFDMKLYGRVNGCPSPACAIGHFAARGDLQRTFKLLHRGSHVAELGLHTGRVVWYGDRAVLEYFGITHDEAESLFGVWGCGGAKSPRGAAQYIERFVARKEKALAT